MRRRGYALVALASLLLALPSVSQAGVELRSAASLDIRLAKPLELSFEEELRFDMRPGEAEEWLQSVVLKIKPVKWLRIEPGYRLSVRPGATADAPDFRHRLSLALRLRLKLGLLRLGLRERYQVRFTVPGDTPRQQLVSEVTAKFRHDKMPVIPAVWFEFFLRLPEDEDKALADKLRVGLGVAIPTRAVEIGFAFQLEKSIEDPDEPPIPILGISFEFELDPRPKKKAAAGEEA